MASFWWANGSVVGSTISFWSRATFTTFTTTFTTRGDPQSEVEAEPR